MAADTHAPTGLRPEGSRRRRGVAGARRVAGVFARSRLGSTVVEFAIAMPVLMLFFFGMFELTRAVWIQITLELAVEQAARFAIVKDGTYATDALFETAIETEAINNAFEMNTSDPPLTLDATIDRSGAPAYVTVDGTYVFTFSFDYWKLASFNITAKSRQPIVD